MNILRTRDRRADHHRNQYGDHVHEQPDVHFGLNRRRVGVTHARLGVAGLALRA